MRISACEGSDTFFFWHCLCTCYLSADTHDTKRNKIQKTTKKILNATSENEIVST